MAAFNDPHDETKRLLALHHSNLLDSAPEERFDRITRSAARCFNVNTALVSLVDVDRQWFKSKVGLEAKETGRDVSFCAHAIIANDDVFVVNDTTKDTRFWANPLVTMDPKIRFYAGAPIRDSGGQALGTLCLIDPSPREFPDEQKQALRDFADMVEHEIAHIDYTKVQHKLTASMVRTSSILATLPDIVFVIDHEYRFLVCNEHPDLPYPRRQLLGRTIEEAIPSEWGRELAHNVDKAFCSDEVIQHDYFVEDTQQSFEARYKKIDRREVLVIIRNNTDKKLADAEVKRLSEVARQTTNGVIITDKKGLATWANEGFTNISGYHAEDIIGKKPGDLLQGDETDPATIGVMGRALSADQGFNVDLVNYSKAGSPYWVRIACNPMLDKDGELSGYIAVQTDITKERENAALISSRDRLLKSVIDANNIGTWQLNIQTNELFVNDQWIELLGYRTGELIPTSLKDFENLTHPDDLAHCLARLEKHAIGQAPVYEAFIRMKHKNGEWVWIDTRGRIASRTNDGKAEWLLGTHFDVSDRMKAEKTLLHQSKQMQAIVENMLDGVISTNPAGIVLTFNQAAERMFGYKRDEIVGENMKLLVPPSKRDHLNGYLADALDAGKSLASNRFIKMEALCKNGMTFPLELGVFKLKVSGETTFIGIVKDITDREKREHEIEQLAFYDPLTKLPNRRLLRDRLQHVIANGGQHNHYAALLFLDLNNFKNLNDSAGHNIGDLLLQKVSQRLLESVRKSDTVARLGGDEFVILAENLSTDVQEASVQAQRLAEKISAALKQGFNLNGSPYKCSASIGVTTFQDKSVRQEELLKQADMAMYASKAAGRNGIFFYDPEMQISVDRRMEIEQNLYETLQGQQFQLYYQKQVNQHRHVVGAEVLLRWNHPVKGLVSPAEFIPLAEETGLIVPIGTWVLEEACRTLSQWSGILEKKEIMLAVNISVVQFSQPDFVRTVLNALALSGADPYKLKLEITESLLASNISDVVTKMTELQRHGVSFAIDDFGTGYASLAYLKTLPIDQLKIDQSFVREMVNSSHDRAIVQTIINLADTLNMHVIAEGVETKEQQALLLDMECKHYQGYLFAKPCELENFTF